VSQEGARDCRHRWMPYADAVRMWQVCMTCGTEQHITTHVEQTMETIAYIFRDHRECQ
jgi:hypothetical protein